MESEKPAPTRGNRPSPNTTNTDCTAHCTVKACPWQRVRQRPHTITRGGGRQVLCRCGQWINTRDARSHRFTCSTPAEVA